MVAWTNKEQLVGASAKRQAVTNPKKNTKTVVLNVSAGRTINDVATELLRAVEEA